jgi:hypothetical protein
VLLHVSDRPKTRSDRPQVCRRAGNRVFQASVPLVGAGQKVKKRMAAKKRPSQVLVLIGISHQL